MGTCFGWSVGPGFVNWAFHMRAVEGGTRLTESWEFTTAGQNYFVQRFNDDAPKEVKTRTEAAHSGIAETLAAIKRIIEQA